MSMPERFYSITYRRDKKNRMQMEEANQLSVPYRANITYDTALQHVSVLMDVQPQQVIACCNWPDFAYRPQVHFAIAHCNTCLLLKFWVKEKALRAVTAHINGPVWEDSCVECFIAFGEDDAYYNIEFNCIGAGLVGYGSGRNNRRLLDKDVVQTIRALPFITADEDDAGSWELTLVVPVSVFAQSGVQNLHGLVARANLYKCGDKLAEPHYLSWQPIQAAQPDFHLPAFFGTIVFE
jgi:hypothetical protein